MYNPKVDGEFGYVYVSYPTEQEAIDAWNNRPFESALRERDEKVEAALREIEVELRIIREASNAAKTDLMVSIGNNVSEPIGKLIIKAWETLNGK